MSNEKKASTNPNDSAFPWTIGNHPGVHGPDCGTGMTIRAEFAKAAMTGLLANPRSQGFGADYIAKYAVDMADALIKRLNDTAEDCHG